MAKPIFVIQMPFEYINETSMSVDEFAKLQRALEKKMPDYYVLLMTCNCEKIEYKVFYEKDITDIQFEDLKRIVQNQVNLMGYESLN